MVINSALRATLSGIVGGTLTQERSCTGGSIHRAATFRAAGGAFFVKWNAQAPRGMFATEARGLALLARHRARTPAVVAHADASGDTPGYLVLEAVERGRRPRDGSAFGRELAALHGAPAPPEGFGLEHDNWIGSLSQSNARSRTRAVFYRDVRLGALLESGAHTLPVRCIGALERAMARLEDWIPEAPPELVHGDLWSGNVIYDGAGAAWLIDPAAHWGIGEADLAMSELFGAPPAGFLEGYAEVRGLDLVAYGERRALWWLYPVLVHAILFGGSYVEELVSLAERYA